MGFIDTDPVTRAINGFSEKLQTGQIKATQDKLKSKAIVDASNSDGLPQIEKSSASAILDLSDSYNKTAQAVYLSNETLAIKDQLETIRDSTDSYRDPGKYEKRVADAKALIKSKYAGDPNIPEDFKAMLNSTFDELAADDLTIVRTRETRARISDVQNKVTTLEWEMRTRKQKQILDDFRAVPVQNLKGLVARSSKTHRAWIDTQIASIGNVDQLHRARRSYHDELMGKIIKQKIIDADNNNDSATTLELQELLQEAGLFEDPKLQDILSRRVAGADKAFEDTLDNDAKERLLAMSRGANPGNTMRFPNSTKEYPSVDPFSNDAIVLDKDGKPLLDKGKKLQPVPGTWAWAHEKFRTNNDGDKAAEFARYYSGMALFNHNMIKVLGATPTEISEMRAFAEKPIGIDVGVKKQMLTFLDAHEKRVKDTPTSELFSVTWEMDKQYRGQDDPSSPGTKSFWIGKATEKVAETLRPTERIEDRKMLIDSVAQADFENSIESKLDLVLHYSNTMGQDVKPIIPEDVTQNFAKFISEGVTKLRDGDPDAVLQIRRDLTSYAGLSERFANTPEAVAFDKLSKATGVSPAVLSLLNTTGAVGLRDVPTAFQIEMLTPITPEQTKMLEGADTRFGTFLKVFPSSGATLFASGKVAGYSKPEFFSRLNEAYALTDATGNAFENIAYGVFLKRKAQSPTANDSDILRGIMEDMSPLQDRVFDLDEKGSGLRPFVAPSNYRVEDSSGDTTAEREILLSAMSMPMLRAVADPRFVSLHFGGSTQGPDYEKFRRSVRPTFESVALKDGRIVQQIGLAAQTASGAWLPVPTRRGLSGPLPAEVGQLELHPDLLVGGSKAATVKWNLGHESLTKLITPVSSKERSQRLLNQAEDGMMPLSAGTSEQDEQAKIERWPKLLSDLMLKQQEK